MSKIILSKLLPHLPGVNELRSGHIESIKTIRGHSGGGQYCLQYYISAHLSEESLDFALAFNIFIEISPLNKMSLEYISKNIYPP